MRQSEIVFEPVMAKSAHLNWPVLNRQKHNRVNVTSVALLHEIFLGGGNGR
jgi:hypothetical protein